MTLAAAEFIRRYLLHVLPAGFQRIRQYGLLANRTRAVKLAVCRRLLGVAEGVVESKARPTDKQAEYEVVSGESLARCPVCRTGRWQRIEVIAAMRMAGGRGSMPIGCSRLDSS